MDSVSSNTGSIAGEPTTNVDSRNTFLPDWTFFKPTEFPFVAAERRAGNCSPPYRSPRYRLADGDGQLT